MIRLPSESVEEDEKLIVGGRIASSSVGGREDRLDEEGLGEGGDFGVGVGDLAATTEDRLAMIGFLSLERNWT